MLLVMNDEILPQYNSFFRDGYDCGSVIGEFPKDEVLIFADDLLSHGTSVDSNIDPLQFFMDIIAAKLHSLGFYSYKKDTSYDYDPNFKSEFLEN